MKEWVKDNVLLKVEEGKMESCGGGGTQTTHYTGVTGNDEETQHPKEREPPTSRKQMRKLGEPPRKVQRRTNDPEAEEITQKPPSEGYSQ